MCYTRYFNSKGSDYVVLKPVVRPVVKQAKKKPVLKKVIKPFPLTPGKINPDISCEYKGNFPYKPEMKEYEAITTQEELMWLEEQMMCIPAFAYDTETNTLKVLSDNDEFKFVGISFSWGESNTYYIPVGHVREEDLYNQLDIDVVIEFLIKLFARVNVRIYGWNLKFDFHVLKRIGVSVATRDVFDGMLASWLCDENTPNGLKENSDMKLHVSQEHFKEATETVPNEVKKQFGFKANSKVTFDLVLIDDALPYVCGDAFYTWCNCLGFEKELIDEGMDTIYYNMYIPFLFVLFEMEEQGVDVDIEKLKQMGVDMEKDLDELQYKVYELAGVEFNIGSSQQKAEILFGYRKPDIPVLMNKAPKWLKDLVDSYKRGEVSLEDCAVELDKKGHYFDDKGKIFKKANVNENILEYAFHFTPIGATGSGAPSTDSDTIWRLSQKSYGIKNRRKQQGVEMCKLLMEYSKIAKLKTAFVDGILEQLYSDGKAHPSFNQIGTDSGRLSCSKPNLQQLPKADEDDKYQIRDVFIGSQYVADAYTGEFIMDLDKYLDLYGFVDDKYYVDRKHIIAIDYHNLEMVCLTHFSGDKNLSEMFANDDDAHGSTAVNMFNLDCTPVECKKLFPHLRQAAKIINFMLMYGGGAGKLYESLKSDHYSPLDLGDKSYLEAYHCKNGKQVAQAFIDKYFDSYKGVAEFIRKQKKYAHRNGYVYTILGRKRRLPDINSSDGAVSSYCERLAVNSAIQGTAGDITINAQIRVSKEDRLRELGCNMLIQVHDELVFECPEQNMEEAIQIIKYDMEHPFGDSESRMVKYLRADEGTGLTYQEAK